MISEHWTLSRQWNVQSLKQNPTTLKINQTFATIFQHITRAAKEPLFLLHWPCFPSCAAMGTSSVYQLCSLSTFPSWCCLHSGWYKGVPTCTLHALCSPSTLIPLRCLFSGWHILMVLPSSALRAVWAPFTSEQSLWRMSTVSEDFFSCGIRRYAGVQEF